MADSAQLRVDAVNTFRPVSSNETDILAPLDADAIPTMCSDSRAPRISLSDQSGPSIGTLGTRNPLFEPLLSLDESVGKLVRNRWSLVYLDESVEGAYLVKRSTRTIDTTVVAYFSAVALLVSVWTAEYTGTWVAVAYFIISAACAITGTLNLIRCVLRGSNVNRTRWLRAHAARLVSVAWEYEYYSQTLTYLLAVFPIVYYPTSLLCLERETNTNGSGDDGPTLGYNAALSYCFGDFYSFGLMTKFVPIFFVDLRGPFAFPAVVLNFICTFALRPLAPKDSILQLLMKMLLHGIVSTLVGIALWKRCNKKRRMFEDWVFLERETRKLKANRDATDAILRRLLPVTVVSRLRDGVAPCDVSDHCTIAVCRIHDFASWSSGVMPSVLVQIIDSLQTVFDQYAGSREFASLVKLKTVGDRYFVSQGLIGGAEPTPLAAVSFSVWQCRLGRKIRSRAHGVRLSCGVHFGPCFAGMVGNSSLWYEAFGEAMDVAMAVSSTCRPSVVVTEAVASRCPKQPFSFEPLAPLKTGTEVDPSGSACYSAMMTFQVTAVGELGDRTFSEAPRTSATPGTPAAPPSRNSFAKIAASTSVPLPHGEESDPTQVNIIVQRESEEIESCRYQILQARAIRFHALKESSLSQSQCGDPVPLGLHEAQELLRTLSGRSKSMLPQDLMNAVNIHVDVARHLHMSFVEHLDIQLSILGRSRGVRSSLTLVVTLLFISSIEGTVTYVSAFIFVFAAVLHLVLLAWNGKTLHEAENASPSVVEAKYNARTLVELFLVSLAFPLPILGVTFTASSLTNGRLLYLVVLQTSLLTYQIGHATWLWSAGLSAVLLAAEIALSSVLSHPIDVPSILLPVLWTVHAAFNFHDLESRRRAHYTTLAATHVIQDAMHNELCMQRGLLYMLIPASVVPLVEDKIKGGKQCVVNAEDICVGLFRICRFNETLDGNSGLPQRLMRLVEDLYQPLEAEVARYPKLVEKVYTLGDSLLFAGPFREVHYCSRLGEESQSGHRRPANASSSRIARHEHQVSVLKAAMAFIGVLVAATEAYNGAIQVCLHADSVFSAVVGQEVPTFGLYGPGTRKLEALFEAMPFGSRIVTEQFHRIFKDNETSLPCGVSLGLPLQYRVRGAGVVRVHHVQWSSPGAEMGEAESHTKCVVRPEREGAEDNDSFSSI